MKLTVGKLFVFSFLVGIISFIYQSLQTYRNTYDAETLQQKYGPTAVVVGASEGLGAAWAGLLCSQGLNVITIARRQVALDERKQELVTKHDCKVHTVVLDLAQSEVVTEVFQNIFKEHSVGLLVYNAAYLSYGNFADSLEEQLRAVKVNVESVTRAVHAFGAAEHTKGRNSSGLILMSSSVGDHGSAYVATYGATKAFDTILAHGLAAEWKESMGTDVLSCVPGPTATPNLYRSYNNNIESIEFLLQSPQEVVEECLYALGQGKYSIETGPRRKALGFVLKRLLPERVVVDAMSNEFKKHVMRGFD